MSCKPEGTHYTGCDCWEATRNGRIAELEAERDEARTQLAQAVDQGLALAVERDKYRADFLDTVALLHEANAIIMARTEP